MIWLEILGGAILVVLAASAGLAWFLTEAVLGSSVRIYGDVGWAKHLQRMAEKAGRPRVRIYVRANLPMEHRSRKVAAFSTWSPSGPAVVLSPQVAVWATEAQLHYIFAHELGHIRLGHARTGFLRVALGYGYLFPKPEATRARWELEADQFAVALTGLPADTLEGMR